ncbi:MAG TPA: bifunctional adenosylcobinamide kinase/adenosylcobinamide-phosphate guanylyltransferase [Polyangiaceae bacterium]|jgi:adenosylcobinamide kinase/adenosylcobinamide-phosphate guanylyltransferase|nr:bifunctional adenosylcobinamide kinase/adenosylcobinamide-phosphate guanylyltransferase [Polyangiaceae bacterium]
MSLTFVTGPVRSGKSRFAERLAVETQLPVIYVATAAVDPDDLEWVARLSHHAERRPVSWRVIETAAPARRGLAEVVRLAHAESVLLVDSLGTWLADQMTPRAAAGGERARDAAALEAAGEALCDALAQSAARVVLVSEEVGWSVVPEHPSGRLFRDTLGRLNQRLAGQAERAYLVVSGFALDLRHLAGEPI